jgi:hypothetical protein
LIGTQVVSAADSQLTKLAAAKFPNLTRAEQPPVQN